MQCYSPISIFVVDKYKSTPFGMSRQEARNLLVPCGKCIACRSHKAREWSMRIWHEAREWKDGDEGMFLTLTYNKENVPQDYSLQVRDIQLFYKRLRRKIEYYSKKNGKIPIRIKHFTCGEYGCRKGRPHYHSIIFGLSWRSEKARALIQKVWNKGFCYFGYVSHASSQYVCKYMLKQASFIDREYYRKKYGRERPFIVMSKGIGRKYVEKYFNNILENLIINFEGKDLSVPRTYIKWIDNISGCSEKLKDKLKEQFYIRAEKQLQDLSKASGIPIWPPSYFHNKEDYYYLGNHYELLEFYKDKNNLSKRFYFLQHERFLDKMNNRLEAQIYEGVA